MKKIIFGIIAILSVFALVMTSCSSGGDDTPSGPGGTPSGTTYTVTFDSAGGSNVQPITGVASGAKITKPTDPTYAGYEFVGWAKPAGAGQWDFAVDTVTGNITLTAIWVPEGVDLNDIVQLGDFTVVNSGDQKGWASNGTDDVETELTWEELSSAKYLVLVTKGSSNRYGFGGINIVIQGDGNNWDWEGSQTDVFGGWFGYENQETDTVTIVIDLTKINTWSSFITGTQGKFFICYYPWANLGYQAAYLYLDDYTKPAGATDITGGYGFVFGGTAGTPGEGGDEGYVEKVTLDNGWFAIYKFTLPNGKKWGDYKKVKADYLLDDPSQKIRARLFGNYVQSEVDQVRLGEYHGNKIAVVATWPSGDTGAWILDNSWPGNSAPSSLLPLYYNPETGEPLNATDPRGVVYEDEDLGYEGWFTLTYPLLGSYPHAQQSNGNNPSTGDYWRYKLGRRPADNDAGPFYLGVGLTVGGNDDGKVVSTIKNVIMFGAGAPDVIGEPLFIEKDGDLYRAYAGQLDGERNADGSYPNTNSGHPEWEIISGDDLVNPVEYVELDDITITYDANYPNDDNPPEIDAITFYPGSRISTGQLIAVDLPTTAPTTPAGAAWEFSGWYTAAEGGIKLIDKYQFDTDTTIYAQWGIIQPAFITYNVGNGAGTAPTTVSVAKNTGTLTAVQLGKGSLTGTGDKTVFGGFYSVDTAGATFNYADYSKLVTTATTFAADATIYAYWYKPVAAADLVVGEDVEVTVAGAWGARIDEDGFVIFASGTNNGYLGMNGNDTLLNLGLAAGADLSTYSTCTISYEFKWIVKPVLTAEQTAASWVGDAAGIWKKYDQGTNNGGPSGGSYFSFNAEGGDLVHNNLNNFKATDTATTYDGISVQINAGDDNNNKQRRNGIFGVKITDVVFE